MSKLTTLNQIKQGQYFEIQGIPFLALDSNLNHGSHIRLVDHLVVRPKPDQTVRVINTDEVKRLIDKAVGNHLVDPITHCKNTIWDYEYAKSYENSLKRRRKRL